MANAETVAIRPLLLVGLYLDYFFKNICFYVLPNQFDGHRIWQASYAVGLALFEITSVYHVNLGWAPFLESALWRPQLVEWRHKQVQWLVYLQLQKGQREDWQVTHTLHSIRPVDRQRSWLDFRVHQIKVSVLLGSPQPLLRQHTLIQLQRRWVQTWKPHLKFKTSIHNDALVCETSQIVVNGSCAYCRISQYISKNSCFDCPIGQVRSRVQTGGNQAKIEYGPYYMALNRRLLSKWTQSKQQRWLQASKRRISTVCHCCQAKCL